MCGSSMAWFAVQLLHQVREPGLVGQPVRHVDAQIDALTRETGLANWTLQRGRMSLRSSLTGAVPRMTQAGSPVIHTPERSGCPLVRRGAAADKSALPLAVRGARKLGYVNHCAWSGARTPTMTAIDNAMTTALHLRSTRASLC